MVANGVLRFGFCALPSVLVLFLLPIHQHHCFIVLIQLPLTLRFFSKKKFFLEAMSKNSPDKVLS
jgi:hypothetical protein